MDWLVVLFILIGVVMNILQKINKDAARHSRPYRPPGRPSPSLPLPEEEKEESIYREAPSWSMEEGEGGSTEGISLEGDFAAAEPVLVPEVLREQEELAREREAFYREAMALIQEEDEEGEDFFFDRETSRPGMEKAKKGTAGEARWFSTQEELLRAMVALEVFGPPGGRAAAVLRGGQKLHGA